VCICSLRDPACNAHAPYCHLWPLLLYIFIHYLIVEGHEFGPTWPPAATLTSQRNKFKNRVPLPSSPPFFPLRCVEGINPLNAELNHICHLLTLLGAHPIFHISRIRVKVSFWTAASRPKTYVNNLYPTEGEEGRGKGEGNPIFKFISL